ncbi:MAG TPA: hypothetical protein VGL94_12320 [Ktedonobacteraceae bacterium]
MTEIAHQGSSEERNIVNIFSSTRRPAPDFMTIYNHHQLSIEAIHIEGRVSRAVVACMLVKIAVPEDMAKKVLDGVNKLCKTNYTLDTVHVSLVEVQAMTTAVTTKRVQPSSALQIAGE